MANDWVTAQNEAARRWNALQTTGNGTLPQYMKEIQAPANLPQYAQTLNGGDATKAGYDNWNTSQQRTNALMDFTNKMANPDAFAQGNTTRTQADATKYGQGVDAYLSAPAPMMSTDNRYAAGLTGAEGRLNGLLDNPDSINKSAAYKFRVGQGQEALQRSLGAKGLLNSGNRLMELTKYGQDMGSQEYDNQFNRLNSVLGTYAQGYNADKNANTSAFDANSNAWGRRGGLLAGLYGGATTAANQDIGNRGNERVGFANAWTNQAPKPYQYFDPQYAGSGSIRIG